MGNVLKLFKFSSFTQMWLITYIFEVVEIEMMYVKSLECSAHQGVDALCLIVLIPEFSVWDLGAHEMERDSGCV